MAIGKVMAHLCLTLIIKELKISAKQERVVTTLNITFNVYDTYEPYPNKFPLHLDGYVLIYTRI